MRAFLCWWTREIVFIYTTSSSLPLLSHPARRGRKGEEMVLSFLNFSFKSSKNFREVYCEPLSFIFFNSYNSSNYLLFF